MLNRKRAGWTWHWLGRGRRAVVAWRACVSSRVLRAFWAKVSCWASAFWSIEAVKSAVGARSTRRAVIHRDHALQLAERPAWAWGSCVDAFFTVMAFRANAVLQRFIRATNADVNGWGSKELLEPSVSVHALRDRHPLCRRIVLRAANAQRASLAQRKTARRCIARAVLFAGTVNIAIARTGVAAFWKDCAALAVPTCWTEEAIGSRLHSSLRCTVGRTAVSPVWTRDWIDSAFRAIVMEDAFNSAGHTSLWTRFPGRAHQAFALRFVWIVRARLARRCFGCTALAVFTLAALFATKRFAKHRVSPRSVRSCFFGTEEADITWVAGV